MAAEEEEEEEENLPDYLNTYPMTPDDLIGDACMRELTLRAAAWCKERYGDNYYFDECGNPHHRPDAAETPPPDGGHEKSPPAPRGAGGK